MDIKPIETIYNGYKFRSRLEARWAIFFDSLGVKYEYEPEGFSLPSGKKYLPDFRVKCYGTRGYSDSGPFDLYIEVKGKMTQEDADRIVEFSRKETRHTCPHYGACDVRHITRSARSDYDDHERRWEMPCGLAIGKCSDRIPDYFECAVLEEPIWLRDEIRNPVLIVGNIPGKGECTDNDACGCYEPMNGIHISPFNFELIDGDYFGAYPTAYKGRFYLMGDDSNYTNREGIENAEKAYAAARQARFEHGEQPIINKF